MQTGQLYTCSKRQCLQPSIVRRTQRPVRPARVAMVKVSAVKTPLHVELSPWKVASQCRGWARAWWGAPLAAVLIVAGMLVANIPVGSTILWEAGCTALGVNKEHIMQGVIVVAAAVLGSLVGGCTTWWCAQWMIGKWMTERVLRSYPSLTEWAKEWGVENIMTHEVAKRSCSVGFDRPEQLARAVAEDERLVEQLMCGDGTSTGSNSSSKNDPLSRVPALVLAGTLVEYDKLRSLATARLGRAV